VSTEETRALVQRYFEAMQAGSKALPELLADDVSWWVPPSRRSAGCTREGEGARADGPGVGLYHGPLAITLESLIAEATRPRCSS